MQREGRLADEAQFTRQNFLEVLQGVLSLEDKVADKLFR